MTPTPSNDLFDAVYEIGQRMCAALDAGELELFFELVHERGTLLESIQNSVQPAEIDPEQRRRMGAALAEQQQQLVTAAAAQHRRLGEALVEIERFKSARQQYRQQPRGGRILSEHLSV